MMESKKATGSIVSALLLFLYLLGGLPLAFSKSLFIFLCLHAIAVPLQSSFEIAYDNCTCSAAEETGYVQSLECYVGKNIKRRAFFVEFILKKEIKEHLVNLLITLPHKNGDFVILNLTGLNGCDILANRNKITLIQIGRRVMDRYSNFPRTCHFKKDFLYYIRGFRLDLNMVPALAFETSMNAWMDLFVGKRKIISLFIQSHTYVKNSKKGNA